MRQLIGKRQLRQLEIIESLFYSKTREVHQKLMMAQFDITERVLKDDIDMINQNFDYLSITMSSDYYRIKFDRNYSIDNLYSTVLRETQVFRLLVLLFNYDRLESADIEEKLYLSTSTLYRLVSNLNPILEEKYGFTIASNPYYLSGPEINIRSFFNTYYLEAYSIFEWPFKHVEKENIENILSSSSNHSKDSTNIYDLRVKTYRAAVDIMRNQNGYNYHIKHDNLQEDFENFKEKNAKLISSFEDEFGVKLSLDLAINLELYSPEYGTPFSYDNLINLTKENKKVDQAFRYLETLIDYLTESYELILTNKNELILELFKVIWIEEEIELSYYLIYPRYTAFENQLTKRFTHFHQEVKTGLKEFMKILDLDSSKTVTNRLIYSFYLYWKDLFIHLEQTFEPIKALVLSDHDARHANAIKDMLKHEFSEQLTIETWDRLDISKEAIEETDYELIVASFSLGPIKGKYCCSINNIPTISDFRNITEVIDSIKRMAIHELSDTKQVRFI